jgi:hypothetical protein
MLICWGLPGSTHLVVAVICFLLLMITPEGCFLYFLKHKYEAFDAFKAWKVMVEKQTERKVKVLRTDNGLDFFSNEFKLFCRKEGIVRHHTIPHTPQ